MMKDFSWHEFRPSIIFLVKFIGLYLAGNLLYGFFITAYEPRPDPVTHVVAVHSAQVLNYLGETVTTRDGDKKPITSLLSENQAILDIYEGCNGINVAIIFLAFIVAFGPFKWRMLWFSLVGMVIIHLTNLGRIVLLFVIARYHPDYMYFMHKYFFTAVIYFAVFVLWLFWVKLFSIKKSAT